MKNYFSFFHYRSFFSSKEFAFFLALTALNVAYGIYFQSVFLFLIREIFLVSFTGFTYFFKDEIALFSKEEEEITKFLKKKYPILHLQLPLFLLVIGMGFVNPTLASLGLFYEGLLVFYFAFGGLIGLMLLSIYGTVTSPEVSSYYKFGTLSSSKEVRHFGTVKTVAHVCKICAKIGFAGGGLAWGGPKLLVGDPFYRGDIWNWLSFSYTGMYSSSDIDMGCAMQIKINYPEDTHLILKQDEVTIDREKLNQLCKDRNVTYIPAVTHKLSFG